MTETESTEWPRGLAELPRSRRAAVLLSVLIVTAIGAAAGFLIWDNHRSAIEEHRREMNSMGVVLAEHTSRYAQVIDLTVAEVRSRIVARNVATAAEFQRQFGTPETRRHLADRAKHVPGADAIGLIDANGQVVNWSRDWPAARVDAAGRDVFSWLKDHDEPGVFIGSPPTGLAGSTLNLLFARRVNGPDGAFLGVVLAILNARYFVDFYRAAGEPMKHAVVVLRRDGTILMRYPNAEASIGVKIPPTSPWFDRVTEGGGDYVTERIVDRVRSRISVHLVRDYPLVINIVMDEADVLAEARVAAVYIAGFALAAALSFSSLFWVLARQFRRQAGQNARLEEAAISLREGQETLRSYAEMSVGWFWEQDAEFRFKKRTIVPSLVASDNTGKTRWEIAGPAFSEEYWARHKAHLAARRPFRDFRLERIDTAGKRHYMIINGDPVFDRNGTFTGYRGTGREVTAEVEATARLARANAELELGHQRFDAVLSNIPHGVCFFDGDRRLILSNRRYGEIYDLPPEATRVGRSLEEIVNDRYAVGSAPKMSQSDYLVQHERLAAANQPSNSVHELRNGRIVAIYQQPMPGGGWVATHEDITERQQAEARIAFLARHDTLTRLPNRALFRERMEQAIDMSGRGTGFAVICLDLDNFKQINDTLGHPVGDALLAAVADRLQACVREGDTVARLGGDEFAIIQLAVHRPEDAELLTTRIMTAFRQPFAVDGHQVMTGTSIGVALAPADSASYDGLMGNADVALYLAKTEGRGTVRFFEPEHDSRIHLRRMLEFDLQGAIARHEFELHYQPIINLAANRVVGFEALLRWHHPDRGLVSPADFIPVAEETGMIVAIGEWVLRTACFEAENWPEDVIVAVNLSPVQFRKGDLIATVQDALDASGLRPDRLELEITESVLLHDTAGTLAALHQLRGMGICVALDDFGTGYSSLSYLRSFPFNKIKIDKSFVRDLVTNKESMSIIRAVTGLGQSLNVTTTAEGVETAEQLNRLREEGCTQVQGYLFSRPRPASELPSLIEQLQHIREGSRSEAGWPG